MILCRQYIYFEEYLAWISASPVLLINEVLNTF